MLPDDTAARLRHEARRRGVSIAEVVREAVERHVPAPDNRKPLSFIAIDDGGSDDVARRSEELFAAGVVAEYERQQRESRRRQA
jgi:hypothetical protein